MKVEKHQLYSLLGCDSMSQVQWNNVSEESPSFSEYVFYNENAGSRSSELFAPFMRLHDIVPQTLTFTFTATITSHLTCTALELIINIHKQPYPHLVIHVSWTINCQDYIVLIVNKIWKRSTGRTAMTKGILKYSDKTVSLCHFPRHKSHIVLRPLHLTFNLQMYLYSSHEMHIKSRKKYSLASTHIPWDSSLSKCATHSRRWWWYFTIYLNNNDLVPHTAHFIPQYVSYSIYKIFTELITLSINRIMQLSAHNCTFIAEECHIFRSWSQSYTQYVNFIYGSFLH